MSATGPTAGKYLTRAGGRSGGWLYELFSVDVRALAVMRIGMSLVLWADLAGRATSLTAHYTDVGILPRTARMALAVDGGLSYWSSLHMLSGATWFQALLFLLAASCAGCLLAGFRTRLATACSWLLLVSLQSRNPLVLEGGDVLLHCFLFWSMFLPLGAVWSVDALRRPWPADAYRVVSAGSAALLLQLCIMYAFSALLKADPAWRSDFTAIYYVLSIDHYTSPLGYWLLEYPELMKLLTASTWLLEWCGPILLFSPVATATFRTIIVLAFVGLHLGLALSMELGHFTIICMIYWLAFLPGGFWNWVSRTPLSVPRPPRPISSVLANCAAGFLLAYVMLLNTCRLSSGPTGRLGSPPLSWIGKATALDQYWNMFSHPYKFGGWLSFQGGLAAGGEVNLWPLNDDSSPARPASVSGSYRSQWWRRGLTNLYEVDEPLYRQCVADFLRRNWQRTHPGQTIVTVELFNNMEHTRLPGSSDPETIDRQLLLRVEYPTDVSAGLPHE